MIKEREIPTPKKYLIEVYDDVTGVLIKRAIRIEVPTINNKADGSTLYQVRHYEDEYVNVYADDEKQAAIITAEIMVWDVVKVMKSLKNNRGQFYDSLGRKLIYDFRSKKFYLHDEEDE